MTTAGLLAGPAGVATVTAAGVLATAGIAAVRRFAPGTAEKLGLRKPDRDKKSNKSRDSKGKSKTDGTGKNAGARGGLGRLGLLGGGGRKKNAGDGAGRKCGGGLLGIARNIAGKGAGKGTEKRGANAAGKKGPGLLGGKDSARTTTRGRNGSGPAGGGKQRSAAGPGGRTRGAGAGAGNGPGRGTNSGGRKGRNGTRAGGGRLRRIVAGAARWWARCQMPGSRQPGSAGGGDPSTGKAYGGRPDKRTEPGSGLLGGGKKHDSGKPKDKPRKDKGTKGVPAGRGPRGISAGKPDPSGRRTHGGPMPDPFASRREAISGAAPLEIERANDLIDYVNHAPEYAEAQASRWESEARAIREQIDITPEFADALSDFAAAQHQQVVKVREYGETFRRGHADRLSKLQRSDPREEKWDIGRNRG